MLLSTKARQRQGEKEEKSQTGGCAQEKKKYGSYILGFRKKTVIPKFQLWHIKLILCF